MLVFISCSSNEPSQKTPISAVIDDINESPKIASQPLIYHDDENISILTTGYGTFGAYEVATKSIPNRRYDYNETYKNLHLQTVLYYPKALQTPLPTLFFYSGYGMYDPQAYKALLYFIASKGYNAIFLTCPRVELGNLVVATKDAIEAFATHIDKDRVGFIGHSMGAGVTFWMINALSDTLGKKSRLLFPMASGYTVFNDTRLIPAQKSIVVPENTIMIEQVYAQDYSTDIRIGFDIFSNISTSKKLFMFLYGDAYHSADHGTITSKNNYHYDALMQRSIFRPLDALMDATFHQNNKALKILTKELQEDRYFHPYIGTTPIQDINASYVLPITDYPFNCREGGTVVSVRKEYCENLGL